MDLAIQAEGLRKRFGKTQALDGVDLAMRRGTVLGVLGPNGAGKTTAVRVLATLLKPATRTATKAGRGHSGGGGHRRAAPAAAGAPAHRPDRPVRIGGRGPDRHAEP